MINSEETIVCYMDILGYSALVEDVYNKNREIIEEIAGKLNQELVARNESTKEVREKYNFKDVLKVQILSDSIILVLPIPNKYQEGVIDEELKFLVQEFLFQVSYLWIICCENFVHLIRGGIAIGPHFQRELNVCDNQFIFSKALVTAVKNEKKADWPRIIVDEKALDYIKKIIPKNGITKDIDDFYCFDVYYSLINPDDIAKNVFKNIVKIVQMQVEQIKNEKEKNKILHKYYHFAKVHNKKVKKYKFNEDEELYINQFNKFN